MSKTTKGLIKAFLITAMLLAGLIFLTGGKAARMAAVAHGFLFPSYKEELVSVSVTPGTTLWELAGHFIDKQDKAKRIDEFVYDISTYNNIGGNDHLIPGQEIIIPLYKEI